jgi:hypothetical protein
MRKYDEGELDRFRLKVHTVRVVTWRGYVLLLTLLSLIAGSWWSIVRLTTPPAPFPSEVLSIVENPERVRVQKMVSMVGSPPEGAAYYENCSMVGFGRAIDPPKGWLSEVQSIVTNSRSYGDSIQAGTPSPKVVIRFVRGETKIDVMLAFDVDTVIVQQDGKPCGTGVFKPRRKELLALVKRLFPDDGEIQAISEI